MFAQFENVQKASKESVDTAMKSFGALSKNTQEIMVEVADYSKKSFEGATAAAEKLFSAKSADKAFEIQADYIKSAYEGYVAHATKLGEMVQGIAKEAFKPYEALVAKAQTPAK